MISGLEADLLIGVILFATLVVLGIAGYQLLKRFGFTLPSLPERPKGKTKQPKMSDRTPPAQIPLGRNVPIEITAVNKKGTARVVVRRGSVGRDKKILIVRYRDLPKWGLYFINLSALWGDNKLHFRREICEPIDEAGNAVRSEELEAMLVDAGMVQITDAIAVLGNPIRFNRTTIAILVFLALFGLSIGLSLNSMFHFVGNVNTHWIPTVPVNP